MPIRDLAAIRGEAWASLRAVDAQEFLDFARPEAMDIRAVEFSPEADFLAAAGTSGDVTVWNLTDETSDTYDEPWRPRAQVFDTATRSQIGTIEFEPNRPEDSVCWRPVAVSPDGMYVAAADGSRIRLSTRVEVDLKRSPDLPDLHHGTIWALAFSRDGRWFASASDVDRKVVIWDFERRLPHRIPPV